MAATSGIDGLVTPYTTSEFHAITELIRKHHHAVHDQKVVVAAELRRMLGKVQGATLAFGVDSKIAARRVTRHIAHSGALDLAAAKATVRAFDLYVELFTGRRAGPHGKTFNVNK